MQPLGHLGYSLGTIAVTPSAVIPSKNHFSKLPKDLLATITLFLQMSDVANLSCANSEFNGKVAKSLQVNFSRRIVNLTQFLSENRETPESDHPSLAPQQESKLKLEQDLKFKEILGSKDKFKPANLEKIEEEFMVSLSNLWTLRQQPSPEELKKQKAKLKEAYDSRLQNPKETILQFPAWLSDLDLLVNRPQLDNEDTFTEIEKVARFGTRYFPLVKQFFDKMSSERQARIYREEQTILAFNLPFPRVSSIIEDLLENNQFTKAANLANNWMKKSSKADCQSYLYNVIIDFYIQKRNLSGVIKAHKTISENFLSVSAIHLYHIISFALRENNYKAISDILGLYTRLDPYTSDFAFIAKKIKDIFEIIRLNSEKPKRQKITEVVKIIQAIPQNSLKVIALEWAMGDLFSDHSEFLTREEKKKIRNVVKQHEQWVEKEIREEMTFRILTNAEACEDFADWEIEILEKNKKEKDELDSMSLDEFIRMDNFRKEDNLQRRQLKEEEYFNFLFSSIITQSSKINEPSMYYDFFEIMTDKQKIYQIEELIAAKGHNSTALELAERISDENLKSEWVKKIVSM